jgi:hypothetical protein
MYWKYGVSRKKNLSTHRSSQKCRNRPHESFFVYGATHWGSPDLRHKQNGQNPLRITQKSAKKPFRSDAIGQKSSERIEGFFTARGTLGFFLLRTLYTVKLQFMSAPNFY